MKQKIREFAYGLATDKLKGPLYAIFKFLLLLASFIFLIMYKMREALYKLKIFKTHAINHIKIIGIGNITWGGTGKTPFTSFLADLLVSKMNKKIAIIMRGYGEDEYMIYKKRFNDNVMLFKGKNKLKSVNEALNKGAQVAIIDDSYQYLSLKKDMEIVLLNANNPFGNGHLIPRGMLRNVPIDLKRADIACVSKVESDQDYSTLYRVLSNIGINEEKILSFCYEIKGFYDFFSKIIHKSELVTNKKFILVSSIADPAYFYYLVNKAGVNIIKTKEFMDHHQFDSKDVQNIINMCIENKADGIIATEKDAVKLYRFFDLLNEKLAKQNYKIYIADISIKMIKGFDELTDRLYRLCGR